MYEFIENNKNTFFDLVGLISGDVLVQDKP
jgi:hypothetical protein